MQKVLFILGQLNDDDVEWLIREGVRDKVARGHSLIEQGKPNHHLFILLEGHVSVSVAHAGEIDVLGSGEIVGEMSLVDSRPPSATVTAIEDCWVLRLDHAKVRDQVEHDVGFGMRFYRALATYLSYRLRTGQALEFDADVGVVEGQEQVGELGVDVLDRLHVAGARFDRIVKALMSA